MTCIAFTLHVTEPETGTIHSLLDGTVEGLGTNSTYCGADCSNWPVLVGGKATCDACLLIGSISTTVI